MNQPDTNTNTDTNNPIARIQGDPHDPDCETLAEYVARQEATRRHASSVTLEAAIRSGLALLPHRPAKGSGGKPGEPRRSKRDDWYRERGTAHGIGARQIERYIRAAESFTKLIDSKSDSRSPVWCFSQTIIDFPRAVRAHMAGKDEPAFIAEINTKKEKPTLTAETEASKAIDLVARLAELPNSDEAVRRVAEEVAQMLPAPPEIPEKETALKAGRDAAVALYKRDGVTELLILRRSIDQLLKDHREFEDEDAAADDSSEDTSSNQLLSPAEVAELCGGDAAQPTVLDLMTEDAHDPRT